MALFFRDIEPSVLALAKDLMRAGMDLKQAAAALGVAVADLDLMLWHSIGQTA